MAYRESGSAVMEYPEEWIPVIRGGRDFSLPAPEVFTIARIHELAPDEGEQLKEDFRRLRLVARTEFKNERTKILQHYEERLVAAKEQYLEDAVASRERLLTGRRQAREKYEEALKTARLNYEFTMDLVEDQYRIINETETGESLQFSES